MAGGRQAWCPRCDEVRAARPGAACPVCGRQLLTVPPARPGQPQPGPVDRVAGRLRALAPLAGAVGVALLVLVVVGSAFVAGRLTRTTPSAPAAAPTTTVAGFLDEGPETGRRDFNWEARAGGITVRLRSLIVGTGFSRLELHVDGVRRSREISSLQGLRIRGRDGRDLLAGEELATIATAASRPNPTGGVDTEVVLDRPIDLQAVGSVELRGLTVARWVEELLGGLLLDRELRRRAVDTLDDGSWLTERAACPDCRLRVTCRFCRTIRVVGSGYHRGRMTIAVEARDRVEQTALNPSRRRVLVTSEGGVAELGGWIDGTGQTAAISVGAGELAAIVADDTDPGQPMAFEVRIQAQAEQAVRGGWAIRQAGG